jgi:amino acid transporter
MIAVAMVVGAGIFKSPSLVAANAGSAGYIFAAWALGGVVTLAGALCYAELASAFPDPGGDYHFLKLAYGRPVAFLFAWSRFAVINTGSIAMLAFVLGDYANVVWSLGPNGPALYALATVAGLTAFNLRNLYAGARTDFGMTGMEVAGLGLMIAAGVWIAWQGAPQARPDLAVMPPPANFGLAMVFVLLAFGGWSEIATLSAEVKDRQRGMVRAMTISVAVITLLYLAVNWAFWRALGVAGLAASDTPAAEIIQTAFGAETALLVAAAIALATMTSINATLVVGARTTFAVAKDYPALDRVARWDKARGVPVRTIVAQGVMASLLVGMGAAARDGFAALVDYTAPVFWAFMSLSAVALFVLRRTKPDAGRPFRTPLYPVTPAVFLLASLYGLWSSLDYVKTGALAGLGVLAVGGLVWLFVRRKP